MIMGKSLSMEYTTMEQEIKNLKKASAAFDTTAQKWEDLRHTI